MLALLGCQFRIGAVQPPASGAIDDLGVGGVATPGDDLAAARDLASARDLELSGTDLFPATGELVVAAPDAIPNSVDLSLEGTVDWAHCGYLGVAGVDDRLAGGPAAISIGATSGTIIAHSPYTPTFTWTNGAPAASVSTQSGVYLTGVGNGLTVSVPASTTPRTLRVYVDVYEASAQLTAHLSDASAPDFASATITATNPGSYNRFTIKFNAASSGQTLTVTWTMTADVAGSIDLLAATLY